MKRWTVRRWKKWVAVAIATAATSTGCTRQLYMTPETQHIASSVGLPSDLATNPNAVAAPDTSDHKPPATVLDSTRELRNMTLQEAFALALERGNVGSQFLGNLSGLGAGSQRGSVFTDDLAQTIRPGSGGDDSIRAFALDPAVAAADIEGALSKFDARLVTSMSWQKRDTLVANIFNNFNNGDIAAFSSGLIKPMPSGGTAGILFETNYSKLGSVPGGFAVINPSYQPALTFQFEQPLLRDNGIDINQLLPQHPGATSIQNSRSSGGRSEGILVTRLRTDQAKNQFEREVNLMLINVESTYWQLYASYFAKYAAETVLKLAYRTYADVQQLELAGSLAKQDVAQSRAQLESVRSNYLNALQQVIETERQFRGLLGLPGEDGKRIVPADSPTIAPYKPDWNSALNESLNNRPELTSARQELKIQQLNVMLAQNGTRPDLRLFANYNLNGNGIRLDGPGPEPFINAAGQLDQRPGNALAALADNRFNNWQIGLRFDVPIGTRDAHAQLKVAQLNLARTHVSLKNQERKAELLLESVYQQIFQVYEQIKIQRARRIAVGTQLEGLLDRVKIGKANLLTLFDAQRNFADAIQAEHQAIANYNIAIASFQYAKGSLQQYNNVSIADGPLPNAVAERAADHFNARSAAIPLRERPGPVMLPTDMDTPAALPGMVETGPLPEAMNGVVPTTPVPPPSVTPKRMPAGPEAGPKELKPVSVNPPGSLPGLPSGPDLDAATTLPATPVSRYRPK